MANARDRYVLRSTNGEDYRVEIVNASDYREPDMKYACEITDPEGHLYTKTYGDYFFCGEEFLRECEKV